MEAYPGSMEGIPKKIRSDLSYMESYLSNIESYPGKTEQLLLKT